MDKEIEDFQKAQKDRILSCYIQKAEEKNSAEEIDDFKHHKLMAGYHSLKANELSSEALALQSSTNSDVHGAAKEKKAEASRHQKATEEHREKAKGLYDKEKHGDWNDTIPAAADALKYGSKQSKVIDKKNEDLIEKEDDVKKSKDIEKAKIDSSKTLGKTKSGGYVFHTAKANDPLYSHFTSQDHSDAAELNDKEAQKHHDIRMKDSTSEFGKMQHSHHYDSYRDKAEGHRIAANKLKELHKSQAFEILNVEIEKGGKGSGRKIGQTSRGEDIMDTFSHPAHRYFTKQDHLAAVEAHKKLAKNPKGSEFKYDSSSSHWKEAEKHYEAANKK